MDCKTCHNINAWIPAIFDHNSTQFPLTGKHTTTSCQSCHTNGYTGTSQDCYNCHRVDFENPTNDPNHITANFSQDCKTCHSTNGWTPATFNHNTTQFPLTGKHTTVSCQSCHSSGYSGTPQDCYACHKKDYELPSNNPNHVAANFPIECLVCHTTNGWTPSTFNHDGQYFPIYFGKHRNEWASCSDCHRVPNNFTTFSCIDCHEHRKTKMDSEHSGVSGYSYNSDACLSCHPNGDSDRAINKMRLQ
jgi:nitrate/TMAO reductase-like tetraheme cytochrome c subunit